MFPIPWNRLFRKKDGTLVNIEDAMSGGGGGGSTVEITPVLTEGTKIADFEIDGEEGSLYAPSGGGSGSITFRAGRTSQFNIPANNTWSQTIEFSEAMPNDQYIVTFGLERYASTGAGSYQGNVFYITNKTANGFTVRGFWKEEVTLVYLDWMAVAY